MTDETSSRPSAEIHRFDDPLLSAHLKRRGSKPPEVTVYLLRDGRGFMFKIGVTDHLNRRLRELRNASGRLDLAVVREHRLPFVEAFRFEQSVLERMTGYRIAGEWFMAPARRVFDAFDAETEAARAAGLLEEPEFADPLPEPKQPDLELAPRRSLGERYRWRSRLPAG